MFSEFITFLRDPKSCTYIGYKPKQLCLSAVTYFLITFGVTILISILCFVISSIAGLEKPIKTVEEIAPLWIVAGIAPILEELACRLSLVRKPGYLFISLCCIAFCILSIFVFHRFYTLSTLLIRIEIAIVVGVFLWWLARKYLMNCNLNYYIYGWAILFGLMHITRLQYNQFQTAQIIIMSLYLFSKVIMGLALSYVRLKHGFVPSVLLHILQNLIAFIH